MMRRWTAVLLACAVVLAAAFWILRSEPHVAVFTSGPFAMGGHERALLQFRHVRFCAGHPPVSVELSFAGSEAKRMLPMECGQSTQLELAGPVERVSAVLRVGAMHPAWNPEATLSVVSRSESGEESVRVVALARVGAGR